MCVASLFRPLWEPSHDVWLWLGSSWLVLLLCNACVQFVTLCMGTRRLVFMPLDPSWAPETLHAAAQRCTLVLFVDQRKQGMCCFPSFTLFVK